MNKTTGDAGEELVARWLESRGWKLISRNWRSYRGEVDIIAADGDCLVFIEVKNWPHGVQEDLELAVGRTKQKRIIETAKCFLDTHRQYSGMYVRFDVVFARWDPESGQKAELRHIKDAFSERAE
ncbi:MAG TPA: YraN family protein [Treponemataceae bacterium]|nr:MAG: hypothetical protein BWY39_00574 [Spirochaetes bacterium ADurb.Bin269]HOC29570.1 YraN family protein [Treponemataceae bacterium]HQL32670.1 YraN family protein [Treponemataceae bacterium]